MSKTTKTSKQTTAQAVDLHTLVMRLYDDDVEINVPDSTDGNGWAIVDGTKVCFHWSEDWGIDDRTVEIVDV
uniref:Uncharacterized protein n=1 Tax=viral metagenome TaxID=1070528 RepID=A0A6H1ZS70_9ZZZZ